MLLLLLAAMCTFGMEALIKSNCLIVFAQASFFFSSLAGYTELSSACVHCNLTNGGVFGRKLCVCVCTHPAVAAQLVTMVHSFFLSEGQAFPPLIEVTEPRVNLAVVHTT